MCVAICSFVRYAYLSFCGFVRSGFSLCMYVVCSVVSSLFR